MTRQFSTALILVASVVLPTAVQGNMKTGIFNKIAETTRDLPVTTGGASPFGEQVGRFSLDGFMDTFEELTDKQWGTPSTTLDLDLMGLLRNVFVSEEGHTRLLQEAWGDPEILRTLMDDLPLFDVIKPLRALKEKKTLTPSDGFEAVVALKDTMGKLLTSLQSIRDPESFAEKIYKYATSEDPKWKSLLARIEEGDTTSHLESQQFLLNEEIGDLIDLKALGFGGELPSLVTKAIETTKQNEPLVWGSVLSDPIARRFLDNPILAVQEAVDAASDYVKNAKASAQ
ncbi:Hypothetical protein NocV09_08500070 [Nannochloropsis oceanica]